MSDLKLPWEYEDQHRTGLFVDRDGDDLLLYTANFNTQGPEVRIPIHLTSAFVSQLVSQLVTIATATPTDTASPEQPHA
jgi:hypothetical protein